MYLNLYSEAKHPLIFYLLSNVIKINIYNSIKDRRNNKIARKSKAEQPLKMKTN